MRGAEAALRRCQTPPREPGEGAVAPRAVGGAARHRLVAVHLADATSSRRVCCPARAGVVCAVLVLNQARTEAGIETIRSFYTGAQEVGGVS